MHLVRVLWRFTLGSHRHPTFSCSQRARQPIPRLILPVNTKDYAHHQTRVDSNIDFNWGLAAPDVNVAPGASFQSSWTGMLKTHISGGTQFACFTSTKIPILTHVPAEYTFFLETDGIASFTICNTLIVSGEDSNMTQKQKLARGQAPSPCFLRSFTKYKWTTCTPQARHACICDGNVEAERSKLCRAHASLQADRWWSLGRLACVCVLP
jgi:hypothetical protein